jgi:hypothetical protein
LQDKIVKLTATYVLEAGNLGPSIEEEKHIRLAQHLAGTGPKTTSS